MNLNSKKYERCVADLNTSNNENNFYYILGTIKMKNISFLNNCIYTNVNKAKQNPYLKIISTINNFHTTPSTIKNSDLDNDDTSQLMLTFNFNSNHIALND